MDNVFKNNFGASTRAASRLVRPFETDRSSVSTYWISNPRNEFVGNVAAGSFANGFWLELRTTVHPPTSLLPSSKGLVPMEQPLKLFVDNVAHSNRVHGLRECRNLNPFFQSSLSHRKFLQVPIHLVSVPLSKPYFTTHYVTRIDKMVSSFTTAVA